MEIIESILNFEIIEILKVAVAIITVTTIFLNFRDKFSNIQAKALLKTDFEILEKAKEIQSIDGEIIQKHIKSEVESLYSENKPNKLFNFLYGGSLFIGFGWWTIEIILNSNSFNGWCILTMMISLVGITIIFDNKNKSKSKEEFYRITFHDRSSFKSGCVLNLILIVVLLILTYYRVYNTWYYIVAVLLILFTFSSFSNVKFNSSTNQINESK